MTLDEAIARERKMVEIYKNNIIPKENYHNMPWIDKNNEVNMRNVEEHEQIAEWLEELKGYRDKNKMVVRVDVENMDSIKDKIDELSKYAESQYNKAIDDFVRFANTMPTVESEDGTIRPMWLEEIAEQLKAVENNEYRSRKVCRLSN